MNALKIMDVTFRDGGHRTGFGFNEHDLAYVLPALDKANIDYIEVGYRNGTLPLDNSAGCSGFCSKAYLKQCKALLVHSKMVVMAYPCYITPSDLQELKDCGVDLLRLCIVRGELNHALSLLKAAESIGLDVSVNFTHASKYTQEELGALIHKVAAYHPKIIYFADSNGSLTPAKIKTMYEPYTKTCSIPFGFHAHDNLGLAQANAIAAIDAGVEFIDCSLSGLGKGIGNLRAEFFIAYLQTLNMTHYKLEHLLNASNYVRRTFHTELDAIDLAEFLRGISDN